MDYRCLVFFGLKSAFPIIDQAEPEHQIRRSKESRLPRAKLQTPRFQRNNKAHKTERISPSARPATTVMTQERNASAGVKPESNRLGRRAMSYFSTGKRLCFRHQPCVRTISRINLYLAPSAPCASRADLSRQGRWLKDRFCIVSDVYVGCVRNLIQRKFIFVCIPL
jgi:hypothetical protein